MTISAYSGQLMRQSLPLSLHRVYIKISGNYTLWKSNQACRSQQVIPILPELDKQSMADVEEDLACR